MSRKKRGIDKVFKIFCEGDTEHNYFEYIRKNKKVSLAIRPINMKGGGYASFLEKIEGDANSNCLAKFIVIDGDRALTVSGEMEALLNQYKANPTDELLETIEAEFPLSTVKNIAVGVDLFKGELQQKAQEAQIEELTQSAREYLSENVAKYKEEFKNPAFAVLYGEAFKALGCSLDTDLFVNMLNEFAKEVIKADGFRKEVAKENTDATDEIAGLSLGNSAKQSDSSSEKLLTDMTQEELEQYLTKHK